MIPLLILFGLIALFGVVELRKMSNEETIRRVFSDPIPSMAHDIYFAAVNVQTALAQFHLSGGKEDGYLQGADEALRRLLAKSAELRRFLETHGYEAEEHADVHDIIIRIESSASEINIDEERVSHQVADVLPDHQKRIETLLNSSENLFRATEITHKEIAERFFKQIEKGEKDRAVVAIFVLIGCFIVMLSLFDLVYHYKRHAERATAAEKYNALFAHALQNTRVGVLIRDMRPAGKPVVFVNKAFTRLTGYEFADLTGESSDFLFGWNTDQAAINAFNRAVHLHETTSIDALLYRKDGSPFWSEWHLTPIMGEDNKVAHFVSIFNDVTAVKQTQEDLMQAKLMAEHASAVKTTFLAMMSHEIRTPINGILGVLKLLGDTPLDSEQRHLLGIAATSSRALHGIINDILDYAKMEAGKVEIFAEPFDLRMLVDDVAGLGRTLVGDKKVDFVVDIEPSVPGRLVGDIGRIRQILLNLVSNASKFTDTGSIRIRVYPLMQQEIEGRPGFLMRFEVQDTGMGIGADDQAKLFQEFSQIERSFTRRFGGTGLGLAICRRLVTLMKGEIDVESMPGKGSKFWFMIPIQEVSATEIEEVCNQQADGAGISQEDRSKIKVLLVEDNETNRLVACKYISKIGFSVDEAVNGIEAIQKAKQTRYDIILMDISMPEMDGMMATCQIRALGDHNATVPVVALTAHAMQGDRQLCLAAGMNDYLNKPLEYLGLVQIFERWLRLKIETNIQLERSAQQTTDRQAEEAKTNAVLLFDDKVLEVMQHDLGSAAVAEVTRVFLEDSQRRMSELSISSRTQHIQDTAHILKSCSANCGLIQFSRLMADIERAATNNDRVTVDGLLQHAFDIYKASKDALQTEREKFIN